MPFLGISRAPIIIITSDIIALVHSDLEPIFWSIKTIIWDGVSGLRDCTPAWIN